MAQSFRVAAALLFELWITVAQRSLSMSDVASFDWDICYCPGSCCCWVMCSSLQQNQRTFKQPNANDVESAQQSQDWTLHPALWSTDSFSWQPGLSAIKTLQLLHEQAMFWRVAVAVQVESTNLCFLFLYLNPNAFKYFLFVCLCDKSVYGKNKLWPYSNKD